MANSFNIYLDIDSMFDVKHAILSKLYPDITAVSIFNQSYFSRLKDEIRDPDTGFAVNWTVLDPYFQRRNKRDLALAYPTFITYVLSLSVDEQLDQAQNGSEFRDMKIFVNMYPYNLTEDEQKNISLVIRQYFTKGLDIEFIRKSDHELLPSWLFDNGIEIFIKYNLLDWIQIVDKGDLFSVVLDNVRAITPKHLNTHVFYTKEKADEMWDSFERAYRIFMNVEFLDLLFYSPMQLCKDFFDLQKKSKSSTEEQ